MSFEKLLESSVQKLTKAIINTGAVITEPESALIVGAFDFAKKADALIEEITSVEIDTPINDSAQRYGSSLRILYHHDKRSSSFKGPRNIVTGTRSFRNR